METKVKNELKYNTMKDAPYSLGKLIEWKRSLDIWNRWDIIRITPYSLGKLIEWKLNITCS